jgi:hypothetical protein
MTSGFFSGVTLMLTVLVIFTVLAFAGLLLARAVRGRQKPAVFAVASVVAANAVGAADTATPWDAVLAAAVSLTSGKTDLTGDDCEPLVHGAEASLRRYVWRAAEEDMQRVIDWGGKASALCAASPLQRQLAQTLSTAHTWRYRLTGERREINDAVKYARDAVAAEHGASIYRQLAFAELADTLALRQAFAERTDDNEIHRLWTQAVELGRFSEPLPNPKLQILNEARYAGLHAQYNGRRDTQDVALQKLAQAIRNGGEPLLQAELALTAAEIELSIGEGHRKPEHLTAGIAHARRALAALPETSVLRPSVLNTLGRLLKAQFKQGVTGAREEAISTLAAAVKSLPTRAPEYPRFVADLDGFEPA